MKCVCVKKDRRAAVRNRTSVEGSSSQFVLTTKLFGLSFKFFERVLKFVIAFELIIARVRRSNVRIISLSLSLSLTTKKSNPNTTHKQVSILNFVNLSIVYDFNSKKIVHIDCEFYIDNTKVIFALFLLFFFFFLFFLMMKSRIETCW